MLARRGNTAGARAVTSLCRAEGVGFEPTDREDPVNSFQGCRIQPLCHPSGRRQARSVTRSALKYCLRAMAEWRNWAGDQRCTPAAIERPGTREELAEVVAPRPRSAG